MPIVPSAGVKRQPQKSSNSSRKFGGGQKLPAAAMTSAQYQSDQYARPPKPPTAKTQDTVKQFAFYCGTADTGWMSQRGRTPRACQFAQA